MLVAQLHAGSERAESRRRRHGAARQHDAGRRLARDDATACEFRTAQDVTLWPIEIVSASYFSFAPDLPLNTLPVAQRIKGGVRIRLRTTAGLKFSQTSIDRLSFYLAGRNDVANRLYELCLATGLGVLVLPARGAPRWHEFLPAASIQPVGFSDDEALLPVTLRSFQGYRLLQEYFSFPQRFRFFELTGLRAALERVDGNELELVILLRARRPDARERRRRVEFRAVLHAGDQPVPEARRSHSRHRRARYEYHVVPDRTRPLDFEVYEVTGVVGHGDRRRQRAGVPAVLLGLQHRRGSTSTPRTSRRGASRGWCRRRSRRRGAALELHRQRGVPVARRLGAGAVQRRPAAAVDPDAVHESRSRPADAGRHRARATSRSTSPRRCERSAWSAARAVRTRRWPTAPCRGAPSATCRSTTCRS